MKHKHILALGPHGFFRMAYTEWGDPANSRVLLCVHGLTRNGRDFDRIAQALAGRWRVVCPDMPGRGESDWLEDKRDYAVPVYAGAIAALIAHLGVEQVDWLGTSMGGIIGMHIAALPRSPIRSLIVNDVGPFLPAAAIERIAAQLGESRFDSLDAVEERLRTRYASFGALTDEDWRHLAEISARPTGDGGFRMHYDPGIADAMSGQKIADIAFWPVWESIRCPVLALRGAESDLLLAETAEEMSRRGPRAEVAVIPGCGHAPALMDAHQIGVVRHWLEAAADG